MIPQQEIENPEKSSGSGAFKGKALIASYTSSP
jgi:hypothetical protein